MLPLFGQIGCGRGITQRILDDEISNDIQLFLRIAVGIDIAGCCIQRRLGMPNLLGNLRRSTGQRLNNPGNII